MQPSKPSAGTARPDAAPTLSHEKIVAIRELANVTVGRISLAPETIIRLCDTAEALRSALAERDAECAAWHAYFDHFATCDFCRDCDEAAKLMNIALRAEFGAAVAPAARETQETNDATA